MLNDEQYINYCRERSPLVRQVREKDLVMPDQGRIVAKELGIPYYETSVLTYFGVDEVFENAIRVALGVRRQQRFWLTSKKTLLPTLQAPFCPPKPKLPGAEVLQSTFKEDRQILFDQSLFTDVIFVCGSVGFSAHRFLLAASSPFFLKVLNADYTQEPPTTRCSSETSLVSCSLGSNNLGGDFFFNVDDTEQLLNNSAPNTPQKGGLLQKPNITPTWGENRRVDRRRRSNSLHLSPSMGHWNEKTEHNVDPKPGIFKALNHPAIQSLRIQQCESLDARGRVVTSLQTIFTCTKAVSCKAMAQVVKFIYTGEVEEKLCDLNELRQVAEHLNIPGLRMYTSHVLNKNTKVNLFEEGTKIHQAGIKNVCLDLNAFADVVFRLDDGHIRAHKPLLMARCDMMLAMFTHDDFVECSARVVKFPGVTCFTFKELLNYLYTDQSPRVTISNCLGILELGNRLCLPRLISLTEQIVIEKLTVMVDDEGEDVTEDALKILQPCQVYNADQLGEWCLAYLAQSYNHICRKYPKVLRSMHPENQAWLNVHRWPPIWYLKDYDFYQRLLMDQERRDRPKNLKRARNHSGCLCFSSKSRKDSSYGIG
ncbi:rho-related BTB domain-containing protein 1-like [Tigriopus californicus]|uniref:rho-related BTB domain-containing protein 1-like n=1 Tax=Tigriopus californicus TaxID=6832 RepID=UPI0027DA6502|nr:rho-related BTB domain-containing protein 1-like [Tigriopus californicus]|eukprot:TCALIF_13044-PA protein Name:"Similar to RHOBTB2 Rho-related BTB domain-containing protein 2 (Homo sapiens)" AED:0.07 eAED:0.07 QI:248/1/1/1/0.71/0.87/8/192/594